MVDYKLLRKQITALEYLISDYPDDHILWGLINYLEDVIDKND